MYRRRRMPATLGEKNELIIFVMNVVCVGENVCICVVASWCEAAVGAHVCVRVERRERMVAVETAAVYAWGWGRSAGGEVGVAVCVQIRF